MCSLSNSLLIFCGLGCFLAKRLLRFMQFFQQEEYNSKRFIDWLRSKRAIDRRGTAICLSAALLACLLPLASVTFITIAATIGFLVFAWTEEDPRGTGKISLKMTARAKRIYLVSLLVAISAVAALLYLCCEAVPSITWLAVAVLIQATPLFLIFGKLILDPDEARRQNAFLKEARENLARVAPYTIGITGSFGKTSVKAILGSILEVTLGPTFWPPKSINTPMGITRELRERLKAGHKYAVMEMGAYQVGSIKRICDLTPPQAGIVTAVGIMHLERFGSPENVYKAKSELPQAVPQSGTLVCNGDNSGSRRMASEYQKQTTLLYGLNPSLGHLDALIDCVEITTQGTSFVINWKGQKFATKTKMHGAPALSNILAAFTMAVALGADPGYVAAAVANLEPFDNRLEVKKVGGFLQINDAYNSNPDGFRAALDVLRDLPAGKRILVSPGMIELGSEQAGENSKIGEYAAKICDLIIVVGLTNREAIVEGLRRGGFPEEKLKLVESRAAAFETLNQLRQPGDVTLIENDLPDLYEPDFRL